MAVSATLGVTNRGRKPSHHQPMPVGPLERRNGRAKHNGQADGRGPQDDRVWRYMRMVTRVGILTAVALLATAPGGRAAAQRSPALGDTRSLIDAHCVSCHNDTLRTGGLSLSTIDTTRIADNAETWEKVLHKLRTGQMPPAGRPRPDAGSIAAVASHLTKQLDAAATTNPEPGRVGVHRLNRTEYANAIRDLLALTVDTKTLLLPDEADEGFDNVAASLALSPAHVERYLTAAREISRLAVGDDALGRAPGSATYKVPKLLEQDVRLSEDLPFGSRGGLAVRHIFPLDGEYAFKVRLRRQIYDYIVGMGHAQTLDVRVDGKRVSRFTVGGEGQGTPGPLTWNGEIVGETSWELYMHAADSALEVRAPITAGPHLVSVSFVAEGWEPEGVTQPLQVDFGRGSDEQYDGYAAVDALTITGPHRAAGSGDTPSRRAVFVCMPKSPIEESPCARKIVSTLARRAYRRPATKAEIDTLMAFYDAAHPTRSFDGGIQAALERLLVSVNFLTRVEPDLPNATAGTAFRLSDLDLASRLSFFLWSSIPDERLLELAERGQLSKPATLEQQVRRMLRDRRSHALVESFAMQWLGMRKALTFLPDPNVFPDFDENLRNAFLRETTLFVESQLREDRSVFDLVRSDYSFLNERLAQHYGVPTVRGERFRRVAFSDGVRGGLLGQGGILMVTSYPDRTAPVVRGMWVLDTLLGMPPPPPPPDVPDLATTTPDGRAMTIREQMETHRRNPACAVCHVRMDPLGFAMENFDAIGRWRTTSHGVKVDADAVFPDGTPINGIAGLRAFVLEHREAYIETFVSKMLTYALGRRVDYRDQPAIRKIVATSASADHPWSAIILGIVNSTPFQMRQAGP
jgi:mono/diheme cytochrome c family protein